MRYRLDASDIGRQEDRAERLLSPGGEMVRMVEHRLKEAAMTHRMTHAYKNQTGHLEQGTGAVVDSEGDNEIVVVLEQAEEYASYVADRGLNDFEDLAAEAFSDIDVALLEQAEELS